MRHIISILIANEAGALTRVSGLFAARGYNIESLTVAPTNDASVSRITLVTVGTDAVVDQIIKQTNKLVDVVQVEDLAAEAHLERELLLLKVRADNTEKREEYKRVADVFRANVVDVTETSYVIELTGSGRKLNAFIAALPSADVIELVRSGVVGMERGSASLSDR